MVEGMPVYVSDLCVQRDWVFPKHRFFEWEPKDERACRALGIGHDGPAKPAMYLVGNSIYVHPAIAKQFPRRNA